MKEGSPTRRIVADGNMLIGYTDRLSVIPGETIRLMVSSTAPSFSAGIVRLRHGDPSPEGPGFRAAAIASAIDGVYAGSVQPIHAGSYAVIDDSVPAATLAVWVWPTLPAAGREQVILACGDVIIFLTDDGRAGLRAGGVVLYAHEPLRPREWCFVAAVLDKADRRIALATALDAPRRSRHLQITAAAADPTAPMGPLYIAACPGPADHYNGRIEAPCACRRVLTPDELDRLRAGELAPDRAWDLRAARLVNAPTLAVAGRLWRDDTTDFRAVPDEYAAVHFHEDDLEDAAWEPSLARRVPDELPGGVFAFALEADGLSDHVPFVVRPRPGAATARIGLLLPTLTYLAYGNERLIDVGPGGTMPTSETGTRDPADQWLAAHPEAGRSAYDHHRDGSGVCLVSALRPIPNLRPAFRWWNTNAPERFGADLYLVDWLEQLGVAWDVFTDHDLHAEGIDLLAPYRVILTGTHPEYVTRQMRDALERYLEGGGHLMYLGGNGFYWVTSIDPDRPYLAEIRRGVNGTRTWTSRPGELRHQTTGEMGGLWRNRGRAPNGLVGVGFTSQSDSHDRAPGYRRTPAGFEEPYAWIFAGVGADETIGDFGLYLGGAAGYEIDRCDVANGSPPDAVVLATSQGLHPPSYLLVVEDMAATIPDIDGTTNERVRADMTYVPYPNGGAVFSVGSCSWCGSLSHQGYRNNVARITENVLRRFAALER